MGWFALFQNFETVKAVLKGKSSGPSDSSKNNN